MNLIIFIYILSGIIIVFFSYSRNRNQFFDLLDFSLIWFVVGYSIVPSILLLFPMESNIASPIYWKFESLYITPFVVISAFLVMISGWIICGNTYITVGSKYYFLLNKKGESFLLIVGLLVSLFAFVLYVNSYGGLYSALKNGPLIRLAAGYRDLFEVGRTNVFSKLLIISRVVTLYCFIVLVKKTHWGSKGFYLLICIISFALSIIDSAIQSSRGMILFFLASFFIAYAILKKKLKYFQLIVLFFLFMVSVAFGKSFWISSSFLFEGKFYEFRESFVSRTENRFENLRIMIAQTFAREGGHCIISLEQAIVHGGKRHQFTFFKEYPEAFLILFPKKLFGIQFEDPERLTAINSEFLSGEIQVIGAPPGILAAYYYAGSYFGVYLGVFLFGFISRLISNNFNVFINRNPGSLSVIIPFSIEWGEFVFRGDPSIFLTRIFPMFIVVLMIIIVSVKKNHLNLQ